MNKKFFVLAGGISLFILILVLVFSPKKNSTLSPATSATTALSEIVPINLSQEKRNAIIVYTASIKDKLPLREEEFQTSASITTSISISRNDNDPAEIVHLDINGISYINKNELDETKNPNVTAFKESFQKAIEMLESQNIDPKRLIFSYSDRSYVRETANYWIDKLNLLK